MAAGLLVNGLTAPDVAKVNETVEYEKILKLRDEIFAGTHPRIAIPNRAVEKVSVLSANQSAPASHPHESPFSSVSRAPQLPGLGRGSEEPTQGRSAVLSEIDPVLLTRSDDLVRAELRLLRPRLEKSLRDQFEQKRLDARKRPAQGEGKPDFDVAAILAKVLEVTKSDPSSPLGGDEGSVSSFDENSLYSSRAPDSTPEAGELEEETTSQPQTAFQGSIGANGSVEIRTPHQKVRVPASPPAADPRHEYDPLRPALGDFPGSSHLITNNGQEDEDEDDDEDDEGEYSPPEAMEHVQPIEDHVAQPLDPRSRPLRRYSDVESGKPGSPQDGNFRIVRNHITSLAAPQPLRVSLLAEAKDSMMSQNNRNRTARNNQRNRRDQSPDAPEQGLHPRKKRKLDKLNAKRRRAGGGSPDVKDEPVSPPPFHKVQPLGLGRLRSTGNEPILIDDGPREVRHVRANEQYMSSPSRPMSRVVEPVMPYSEPRSASRATMQPLRDDMDLRRVASLHNMRTEQPQYVEQLYESPIRPRAASYVPVDSPIRAEIPSSYERERSQNIRVVRTPAPVYHEIYSNAEPEIRYVAQPMPPPPPPQPIERIIVDEYGRKFREIIEEPSSMVARAAPVYDGRDRERIDFDNYRQHRAGSVMTGAEQMPPPRMVRQLAEPARHEVYQSRQGSRAVSVAAIDRPLTRQSVYVDEPRQDRYSMQTHYEDRTGSMQIMSRSGSVRPSAREGSVFVEDRPNDRREYLQMEPPRLQHQMSVPQPRYVDAHGREIIMDGNQYEATRHYPGY